MYVFLWAQFACFKLVVEGWEDLFYTDNSAIVAATFSQANPITGLGGEWGLLTFWEEHLYKCLFLYRQPLFF